MIDEKENISIAIYSSFKYSLIDWPRTKLVKTNKFINKCLNSQLQRLNDYGLTIDNHNVFDPDIYDQPVSDNTNQAFITGLKKILLTKLNNSNQTFNNQSLYTTGTKITKYYKNNKLIKKCKLRNRLYVVVTSVNDEQKVLKQNVICPNCGNIVAMSELVNGCSYCKTSFNVSDLYPVVTNYYHYSLVKEKVPFLKYYLITSLVLFYPFYKMSSFIAKEAFAEYSNIIGNLYISVTSILTTLISTLIFTVFVVFIRQIVSLIIYSDNKGVKKNNYLKLETYMTQFDPNFTYYMFEGKMISMLKEIIFSKNPSDLVIYDCPNNVDFSNIVDANFYEMYINDVYNKDNKIYIDFSVDMYNTLYIHNKIKEKKQTFNIVVARNAGVYTTSNFRIDVLNCKNCGAPIDIEKDKSCKYCNTKYDYKDYDFVFTSINIK